VDFGRRARFTGVIRGQKDMEKLTLIITKILSISLIILMAVMVIDVSWQVFTRFILQDPSSFTEELAGFLLIWIGLLGSSYALYTKAHLGIDVLTSKLSGAKKQFAQLLIHFIVILFAIFFKRIVFPVLGGDTISPLCPNPIGDIKSIILVE
jgi:TRAP-type C4-dicarboxylate transport system permease small subunit